MLGVWRGGFGFFLKECDRIFTCWEKINSSVFTFQGVSTQTGGFGFQPSLWGWRGEKIENGTLCEMNCLYLLRFMIMEVWILNKNPYFKKNGRSPRLLPKKIFWEKVWRPSHISRSPFKKNKQHVTTAALIVWSISFKFIIYPTQAHKY